jgi:hypothetical protein
VRNATAAGILGQDKINGCYTAALALETGGYIFDVRVCICVCVNLYAKGCFYLLYIYIYVCVCVCIVKRSVGSYLCMWCEGHQKLTFLHDVILYVQVYNKYVLY